MADGRFFADRQRPSAPKNFCSRSRPRFRLCSFCVPGRSCTPPNEPKRPFDIWKLGGQESTPLARTGGFYPCDAQLSPDERWLAYGRPEASGAVSSQAVYVSALPSGEGRAVAEAASTPRWRADGRELFYLAKDSTVVAMPVDPQRTPSESPGDILFRASGLAPTGVSGQVYDVTPDGQRFLLKREVGPSAIHVVLNWDAGLHR